MPGQNEPLHTTADAVGSALELGFPAPLEPGRPRFPVVVAAAYAHRWVNSATEATARLATTG